MLKLKFNINLNVVKSKNNLEIARRYHHYDNVESMHITLKDDLYHIDAIVSVFNHMQKCSLEIKDNKIVSYKCACPFNDQDSMCGHLGAVIMKLNELEINDFPFDYQSEKVEKMKEIEKENQRQRRKAQLRQLAHTSSRLVVISVNPGISIRRVFRRLKAVELVDAEHVVSLFRQRSVERHGALEAHALHYRVALLRVRIRVYLHTLHDLLQNLLLLRRVVRVEFLLELVQHLVHSRGRDLLLFRALQLRLGRVECVFYIGALVVQLVEASLHVLVLALIAAV